MELISTGTYGRTLDPSFIFLFLAGSVVVLFLSLSVSRHFADQPIDERRLAALIPAALAVIVAMLAYKVLHSPFDDQNWSRLQRTFLLAHGEPIYAGKESGPVLNSIYGPVSAMAYLPATLFQSLHTIMESAEWVAIAFFFLPVFWLHLGGCRKNERLAGLGSFFVFAFFPFITSSIRNGAFHVHADAPALGLGALACAFIYFRGGKIERLRFPLSAVFAVLAFYAKQVMAPLFLALFMYVWITEGRRSTQRYTGWLVASFIFFTAVFFLTFGKDLFFNLFVIPSRHPSRSGDLFAAWTYAAVKFMRESFFIAVVGTLAFFQRKRPYRGLAEWLRNERWSVFLLVAIFLLPSSLAGRAKMGGSTNALCFSVYFLLVASTLALQGAQRITWVALAALLAVVTPVFVHRGLFPKNDRHQSFGGRQGLP